MTFIACLLRLCVLLLSYSLTMRWTSFCTSANIAYSFGYAVEAAHVGVISRHWEENRGDTVKGEYSFLDSDGRVRIVGYQVEGNKGFKAVVRFRKPGEPKITGHLRYPTHYLYPIRLTHPVGLITPDLLISELKTYSHTNLH